MEAIEISDDLAVQARQIPELQGTGDPVYQD
jgi:hypothetical protein